MEINKENLYLINEDLLVINKDDQYEPLDWLLSIYRKFKNKIIAIDDVLFDYIVNNPFSSEREFATVQDGYEKYYRVLWKKTKDYNDEKETGYPEIQIIVSSFGEADETPNSQGRIIAINGEANWHFIEEVFSEDAFRGFKIDYSKQELIDAPLLFIATQKTDRIIEKIENYN